MNKGDNINLYNALSDKKLGSLQGAKFAYAISRNLGLLQPEIEALKKSVEQINSEEKYVAYEKARIKLAEEYANKDDKGLPIKIKKIVNKVETEVFDGLDNNPEWEKVVASLREEHKEAIDNFNKQQTEQNELLKTESTITLYKVALADVPNAITADQMKRLAEIVEESILSPFNK